MEDSMFPAQDNDPMPNRESPVPPEQLVLGPKTRSVFRRLLKWTCLFAIVIWIVIFAVIVGIMWFIIFNQALPIRRAFYLETDYQSAYISDLTRPMVEDIPELFSFSLSDKRNYKQELIDIFVGPSTGFGMSDSLKASRIFHSLLGLYMDGTADGNCRQEDGTTIPCRDREAWIYLGGTAKEEEQDATTFVHPFKRNGCDDPPYICAMYRHAFNDLMARWHGTTTSISGPDTSSHPAVRFADCDISPLLCSVLWGLGGSNMLVHMQVEDDCEIATTACHVEDSRCPITWRYVGLPVVELPWTRQIRIPLDNGGSTVVPAFPSAEEQMWTFMAQSGAHLGVQYRQLSLDMISPEEGSLRETWNGMDRTTLVGRVWSDDENVTAADEAFSILDVFAPFRLWGVLRAVIDLPWTGAINIAKETEFSIKCQMERWMDILLKWWDRAGDIVEPRNCALERDLQKFKEKLAQKEWDELEERHAEKEKLRDAWDRVMKKQGLDPNWIYDEDDEVGQWARSMLGGLGAGFW